MEKEEKKDNVKIAIDESKKAVDEMAKGGVDNTVTLGHYMNTIATAQAEKINEIDENLKKTKLAANIGAVLVSALGLGLGAHYVYSKVSSKGTMVPAAAAAGSTL